MGIVVFGAVFVDVKGYPLGQYVPGGRNAGYVEHVHGGVSRNVAEDIANVELKPTFVSVVDNSAMGDEVLEKLKRHKVNVDYVRREDGGLGTWLAVFDHANDVVASISQRPNLDSIMDTLDEKGNEIFENADSIALEIDMEPHLVKRIFQLAEAHNKKVYAVVSNMSIAMERRDLIKKTGCIVCNQDEAGMLFTEDYSNKTPEELKEIIAANVRAAKIPKMVVTMGGQGAVYATMDGETGFCPAFRVAVADTTGAGDAFFAGVTIGQTYGKTMMESCAIGSRLASSVVSTREAVCPRFMPEEFDLHVEK